MNFQPLNILITVLELNSYSGLPLYTRDIAFELKRQGHHPEVYTLRMGGLADELLDAGIHVTNNPARLGQRPDIIHGQHRVSTLIAVKRFKRSPAIFICHNHTFWGDEAPFHPRILQYFGVSRVCMERLIKDGVPENRVQFLFNFVDTSRFLPRQPLPLKPRKALVFSNYASEQTHLPAIREACHQLNLELDVVGMQTNYVHQPEEVLGKYDLIFAKAKAAMEAMAVGAAVILCDFSGVGPMVTTEEFDKLRLMNFGFQALTQPLHPQNIIRQIECYDPEDAENVKELIRSTASLEKAVKNLVQNYQTTIQEYKKHLNGKLIRKPSFKELLYWERARYWASLYVKQNKLPKIIAQLDPASQESTFLYERKVEILFHKEAVEQIKMPPVSIKIFIWIKMLPIKIWMKIPETLRFRIKKLPLLQQIIKWAKNLLGVE